MEYLTPTSGGKEFIKTGFLLDRFVQSLQEKIAKLSLDCTVKVVTSFYKLSLQCESFIFTVKVVYAMWKCSV